MQKILFHFALHSKLNSLITVDITSYQFAHKSSVCHFIKSRILNYCHMQLYWPKMNFGSSMSFYEWLKTLSLHIIGIHILLLEFVLQWDLNINHAFENLENAALYFLTTLSSNID